MSFFSAAMGFVTGGPVGALLGMAKDVVGPLTDVFRKIEDTKVQLALAKNDSEKNQLTAQLGALQVQADVLKTQANLQAEESHVTRLNIMVRSWIGVAVAIVLTKILVYDKAFGQWTHGSTDALDPNLWYVVMMVLGFYFVHAAIGMFRK